ncbi:hypothetical protein L6452_02937 [Arctium lappa]|uniref:Uncharacterized protein n=1 Tax=Arctium lappa TaxID=4217 RepID=A0ACB9FKY6_ARCLA|nr:hypothetical protein L6452_02937 [Arctium lappa]
MVHHRHHYRISSTDLQEWWKEEEHGGDGDGIDRIYQICRMVQPFTSHSLTSTTVDSTVSNIRRFKSRGGGSMGMMKKVL